MKRILHVILYMNIQRHYIHKGVMCFEFFYNDSKTQK